MTNVTMNAKSGWRTSEWWLTLATTILGAALSVGLIPSEGVATKIAGVACAVLASLGYTVARTSAKRGDK